MDTIIGAILAFFFTYFLLIVFWYVLCAIGNWMMFSKMGEPGWKAFIPFYNDFIIYRAVWNTTAFWGLIALCLLSAFVSTSKDAESLTMFKQLFGMLIFIINMLKNIKLSRSFEHGYLYAFGLTFLHPLFTIILGLGNSRYIGNTSLDESF